MKVLFVDTTTSDIVVAVVEENKVVDVSQPIVGVKHSEILCKKVEEALKKANIGFKDLDAYACAIGPGSFTGIRIGIATLKGYFAAAPHPFISVGCLEAIARSKNCGARGSAVIDAGNGLYFADLQTGVEPCLIPYNSERAAFSGRADGATAYFDGAVDIVRDKFNNKNFDESLTPLYIRKSQAEERR